MAATVTTSVKYRQPECTWVVDSFRARFQSRIQGDFRPHTRTTCMPNVSRSRSQVVHSDALQLHLGINDNSSYHNWSAQLDLMEGNVQQPGLQVGSITLRPLQTFLTSASSGEINVVICIVDIDGADAFETTAEKEPHTPAGFPHRGDGPKIFRFGLPGMEIIRKHRQYLPHDKLRIKATITLCDTNSWTDSAVLILAKAKTTPLASTSTARLVKLSKDMLEIKNSGLQNDFEIICNGTTFPVHQAILAARSQYFATMLGTDMKEKNEKKLTDNDCGPEIMKILLDYIYSSNIEIEKLGSELVSSLTKAADKYQLDELKDICFTHMVKSLSLETAGNVAVTVYLHSAPKKVRETVFQFCATNWQTLASSNEFQAIHEAWPKAFHKP